MVFDCVYINIFSTVEIDTMRRVINDLRQQLVSSKSANDDLILQLELHKHKDTSDKSVQTVVEIPNNERGHEINTNERFPSQRQHVQHQPQEAESWQYPPQLSNTQFLQPSPTTNMFHNLGMGIVPGYQTHGGFIPSHFPGIHTGPGIQQQYHPSFMVPGFVPAHQQPNPSIHQQHPGLVPSQSIISAPQQQSSSASSGDIALQAILLALQKK